MGGGISTGALAGAVSAAGGLGTVGLLPAHLMRDELRKAAELAPERPIAANFLLPFTAREHVDACIAASAASVCLFFGFDREIVERLHDHGVVVMHQVGTAAQAKRAAADGADVLVVQAREAGGHLLGVRSLEDALAEVRAAIASKPVLAAGAITTKEDVRRAVAAGADGVVAGTRFLLTDESNAHVAYKKRVVGAQRTIETTLFGMAWPDRHRVVPNAATRRWCRADGRARLVPRAINRAAKPLTRLMPETAADKVVARQRPWLPMFSPAPLLAGMDERLVEVTALYAGEGARRIDAITPAADAVRDLAAGF